MRFYSPLRYPGGKGNLFYFFKSLIEKNKKRSITYVEPFAGGASLAFSLLLSDTVEDVIINDFDKSVYAFWYSVLFHSDELCDQIERTSVSMEEWYKQKEIQKQLYPVSLLELGFSTFFLNRTNRSGIINGGVIGGKGQIGKWKMDVRYNKDNLIQRVKKIASLKDRIKIFNMDACKFISKEIPDLNDGKLVYLDPPYFRKGPGLYANYFQYEDHKKLASKVINDIKHDWVVSYDEVPEALDLYGSHNFVRYALNYSAAHKHRGNEIMFFSDNLKLPKIKSEKTSFG